MEVYHGINADRQAVQTNLCYSGESNQKWILDGLLIKSALPGTTRCMDRNSENQINLWTCNRSNTNQHFTHDL
ncbi:ricin-type beta-trefoil lectin domain protein [Shewanella sp.]|uniref:ricin-type beta-trefoil lectin domain protein n=1 Tax=Shewanella sp. TaxID=50422 RepID=UPI00345DC6D6